MKIGSLTIPAGNTMVRLEDIELTKEELGDIKGIIDIATKPSATVVPAKPFTVDCEHSNSCTDRWSEKCGSCANNHAISYYEKKEVE